MFTQPAPVTSIDAYSTPGVPIHVLVVDDHPAVREGLRKLIDDQPDMRAIAEARSAEEALQHHGPPVDVAIIDYHLRDGRDGLWLTGQLKRSETPPQVLIYSAFADGALAVMAWIAGADGLLGKHELGQELCRAIRRLARGQHHLPAATPSLAHAMAARLEPRDRPIVGMLLHGTAPEVIAERLGITPDDLHLRRSAILDSLRPARPAPTLMPGSRAPLDYERPRRRPGRWAA